MYEVTYREWKKKFYRLTNEDYDDPDEFFGLCYNHIDNEKEGLPRRFIVINRSLTNSWKLSVFYHELGHYACAKVRCPCTSRNGFFITKTELHAELASLYLSSHRNFKQMTFNLMVANVRDLNHERLDRICSATRLVKHPVFAYARTTVGDMFTAWLDDKHNSILKEKYLNAMVDESARACRWEPSPILRKFIEPEKA